MYINGIIASKVNIKVCIKVCYAKIVLLINLMDNFLNFILEQNTQAIKYSFVFVKFYNFILMYVNMIFLGSWWSSSTDA